MAGIGYATLAYDIATSDTPGQTALAQGAGMAAGTAVGSTVGSAVTGAATSTALSEMAVGAGTAAGVATGALAGMAVAAGVGAIYEKSVPLEWRERIDETFWHLPYHLGLANW